MHYWVNYVWLKFTCQICLWSICTVSDVLAWIDHGLLMYIAWALIWYAFCWNLEKSGKLWKMCMNIHTVHLHLHGEDEDLHGSDGFVQLATDSGYCMRGLGFCFDWSTHLPCKRIHWFRMFWLLPHKHWLATLFNETVRFIGLARSHLNCYRVRFWRVTIIQIISYFFAFPSKCHAMCSFDFHFLYQLRKIITIWKMTQIIPNFLQNDPLLV